ncbi:hypothetical protein HQ520_03700 [bacterium]|nr:hypothetical protein [bacterium]
MKKTWLLVLLAGLALIVAGCGDKTMKAPEDPNEVLLWSSNEGRPSWTLKEPGRDDGKMFFIGRSGNMATEQLAINRASIDGRNAATQYMGTLVKTKFEQARVDFGLSSDVVNPTESSREYTKHLATNYVSRMKGGETYIEKWQTPTGIAWRAWSLMNVPEEALEASYSATAQTLSQDAARKAKEQSDMIAKAQLEKAGDMWKKMAEQGLFSD